MGSCSSLFVAGCASVVGNVTMQYLVVQGVIDGFVPAMLVADVLPALVVGGYVALRVKHRRYRR